MSKVAQFLKNLEGSAKGFYSDARIQGKTAGQLLAENVDPEPDEIRPVYDRFKGQFKAEEGTRFARRVWNFAEQTAALEKCLEHVGIRTQGEWSDRAEKFFGADNNGAIGLFPAVLGNQIIAGMMDVSLVPRIAAFDQRVDAHSVEKITLSDTADQRTLKFTGEGANMPKTTVTRAEGVTRLYKYGRVFEYSYESVRLMKMDLIGLFMRRIGAQIGIDETDDLIETMIAGDGTSGSAITDANDLDAEVSGTTDFDELVRLQMAFGAGYNMTDVIVGDTLLRTILNMSQVQDPNNDYRILQDGLKEFRALGATWHRWRSTGAPSFASDNLLALDKANAVGILREGDFLEESDRIIDRSMNVTAMSEWLGTQKIDNSAVVLYDGTA